MLVVVGGMVVGIGMDVVLVVATIVVDLLVVVVDMFSKLVVSLFTTTLRASSVEFVGPVLLAVVVDSLMWPRGGTSEPIIKFQNNFIIFLYY